MFAIACTKDHCLAVGPMVPTEADAEKKWDARNMNITATPKKA